LGGCAENATVFLVLHKSGRRSRRELNPQSGKPRVPSRRIACRASEVARSRCKRDFLSTKNLEQSTDHAEHAEIKFLDFCTTKVTFRFRNCSQRKERKKMLQSEPLDVEKPANIAQNEPSQLSEI
jgi:hypothetical protein